jgi:hypothetical protein
MARVLLFWGQKHYKILGALSQQIFLPVMHLRIFSGVLLSRSRVVLMARSRAGGYTGAPPEHPYQYPSKTFRRALYTIIDAVAH